MRRKRDFEIEISESLGTLRGIYARENSLLAKKRVKALMLVKGDKVLNITELSEKVGANWNTVSGWLKTYRARGLDALLAAGRAHQKGRCECALGPQQAKALVDKAMEPGAGFNSYRDAWRHALGQGIALSYSRFCKLAKIRHGLVLKSPRPQNLKHDPGEAAEFKKNSRAGSRAGRGPAF